MIAPARDRPEGSEGDPGPLLLHVTTVPMSLTFFVGQLSYMKHRGFRVEAVSSPGPDLARFARSEGIPVSAVEMPRKITPVRDLGAVGELLGVMRRARPTIVHAHTPKGGLLGMVAATLSRTPVRIYHVRGLPLLSAKGVRRILLRWSERVACRLAHRVLCVSRSVRDEVVREGLCPPWKIDVLGRGSGNGVDAEGRFNPARVGSEARLHTRQRLGIPATAPVVGFVGRIVRDKGVVELVEAWRSLKEQHPNARLLLVGPFEQEDAVPVAVERFLRDDPGVHLAGMDWNTPPLYAAMDVVALPTYREGFPNVPLEAAAMGLPIVATRVPGCVDAVKDGITGVLVPPRDPGALARALDRYLSDPALRADHGTAGRAWVAREFRQEVVWEALHTEYLALLGRRPASKLINTKCHV